MKRLYVFIPLLILQSCIPLRIAPNIETDKVMVAKKFKRKLPKQNAFIFEDPKDANEFYHFVNTKFELYHQDVEFNVPFMINDREFYFSFHEVEIPTKTFNILPIFIDAALTNSDMDPMFEDNYFSRIGNWYIVVTVNDEAFNDALAENYVERKDIIKYLQHMRKEYLSTDNYLEALFKK